MYNLTKTALQATMGLSILLLCGCGSTGTTSNDLDKRPVVNDQLDGSGENNESNKTKNYTLSYTSGDGILIEKYGSKNLSWVNATGTACLKYRISGGVPIYDRGVEYCSNLVHSSIDTWRLPTEDEAVHFMANVPLNPNADQNINPNSDSQFLIYPDDGQTCLFMASENSKNFNYVYTTNHDFNGSFNAPSRQTAGIRCVVDNIEEDN